MFGFRGSYDFLYNSFVKSGGVGSLALCLLFYSALNLSAPGSPQALIENCAVLLPIAAEVEAISHHLLSQVPAGFAQAGKRSQRLHRQNIAHSGYYFMSEIIAFEV